MFGLGGDGRHVLFVSESFLLSGGTDGYPTDAAIEADVVNRGVLNSGVVDVVDEGDVHVANGLIVEEVAIVPAAAFISVAKIAKAITNPAVETYLRSPVAFVEQVGVVAPAPVAWSPEIAGFGSHDPCAWDPEVIVVSVRPTALGPDIAVFRADGLLVNGEFGRRDPNR